MNGWSDPILNIALFDNRSRSSPITTLLATDKPPSVCKEPSNVVVASVESFICVFPLVVKSPVIFIPELIVLIFSEP